MTVSELRDKLFYVPQDAIVKDDSWEEIDVVLNYIEQNTIMLMTYEEEEEKSK